MTTIQPRPVQRTGHIGYHENRFCGRAVFADLGTSNRNPIELVLLACGVTAVSPDQLEALRCLAVAVVSPDARVWPLKLARTLASYGDPVAGYFGAQLASAGQRMGPGTAVSACASLIWIAQQVGSDPDDAAVAAAVAQHLGERGRINGFGVPFRPEDERLVALRVMLAGHPLTRRPMWRLAAQVERAVHEHGGLRANIVLAVAAIFLDLGLAPARAGLFLSILMAPNFAAHAIEAADVDGPVLQELPAASVDYQGPRARRSPAEAARIAVRGAGGFGPRRCLGW